MDRLILHPADRPFRATITPPGSKSLSNRALVLGALASGATHLSNVLFAEDTAVMVDSLQRLGFSPVIDSTDATVCIEGAAGAIPAQRGELFCGNSGTTLRFLASLCTLGEGPYVLDGVERMRQRPVGGLVNLLRNLGGRVRYLGREGYPPIQVEGGLAGGICRFEHGESSQFLSSVLMAGPMARHEVRVELGPSQASWPYIAMTMLLMDQFGVTPELERDPKTQQPSRIVVPRGVYRPTHLAIEPDASSAGYFLAAAAIHPGAKVTIQGIGRSSVQGDVAMGDLLHSMGAGLVFGPDFVTVIGPDRLEGIDVDLSQTPDLAQTLAVVALFAQGQSVLRGLASLRLKETDRISALANELKRLGADVQVQGDALVIDPPEQFRPAEIQTYDDHRMAMSFALAGTRVGGVAITNPRCVSKTYPDFFRDLEKVVRGGEN
jgi:3-phosphoshikimate 1-carboxyvinyltransferase